MDPKNTRNYILVSESTIFYYCLDWTPTSRLQKMCKELGGYWSHNKVRPCGTYILNLWHYTKVFYQKRTMLAMMNRSILWGLADSWCIHPDIPILLHSGKDVVALGGSKPATEVGVNTLKKCAKLLNMVNLEKVSWMLFLIDRTNFKNLHCIARASSAF